MRVLWASWRRSGPQRSRHGTKSWFRAILHSELVLRCYLGLRGLASGHIEAVSMYGVI